MTIVPAHRDPSPDPPGTDDDDAVDARVLELGDRLPDADLVPDDDDESSELERYADVWTPSAARTAVSRFADRPLPTLHQMGASTRWWADTMAAVAPRLMVRALPVMVAQVRPTVRGTVRVLDAWSAWRVKPGWLADVKEAEGSKRAEARRHYERRRQARSLWSMIGFVCLLVGLLVGIALWPWHVLIAAIAAVGALDWWGHERTETMELGSILPSAPLREGAPLRMIVAQVIDVLGGCGHAATVVKPAVGQHGVTMDVHTPRELDDKDLEILERGLQTFPGAISQIRSQENAAVSQLRVMWTDPLATMNPPPLWLPLSQTVNSPGQLGYGLGALPLALNFLRTNILVVGGPGSGKSSTFWVMIDYLTACADVVLDGIDLSGGPALDAWGDCIRNFATTPAEAQEVLRDALDLADRRTRKIGDRSRPRRGGGPVGPEHFGTSDGKIHIIVIDELPLLAGHEDLLPLYSEHQRVGRKAASTSLAATQDLNKDTVKATSIRKYPSTTILLPCSREDVVTALGGGKIQEGWAPHRFVPAEGDDANDAGKCFIHSGRHRVPNPWRFNRLDEISDIHSRALDRIDAGRPTLDDDFGTVLDAVVLPDELAMVHDAFTAARWPEFMATDDILVAIATNRGNAPRAAELAKLLAPFGLAPDGTRRRTAGSPNPRKGYLADGVRMAVRNLEQGGAP